MPAIERPIWIRDDHLLPLPTLQADVHADVCVVGLGGSGLACVRESLARGLRVVGVDTVSIAGGAAGRNGGFLLGGLATFHHDTVKRLGRRGATAIYEYTLAEIARMAAETPEAVRRTGSLRIAADDEELVDCAAQYESMRHDGLPVERYEGPEGHGLLFPFDAAFDPGLRCKSLARQLLQRGARLYGRSPAVEIESGRVRTPHASVFARRVVVAVDGRLELVLPELAPRVRSVRLQMLATEPAADVTLPRPVYARWGYDYWQQRVDRSIVLGGARDVGGAAEWTTDSQSTGIVQNELTRILREQVGTSAEVTHRWAAVVGYTETGMPVLEQPRPDVWAIGAYSGTGNVIGALCGRAVVELMLDGRSVLAELLAS